MCCRNMVVAFNKAANNGVAWIQVCFANLATLHAYLHEKDQALECAKQSKKKQFSPLVPCRFRVGEKSLISWFPQVHSQSTWGRAWESHIPCSQDRGMWVGLDFLKLKRKNFLLGAFQRHLKPACKDPYSCTSWRININKWCMICIFIPFLSGASSLSRVRLTHQKMREVEVLLRAIRVNLVKVPMNLRVRVQKASSFAADCTSCWSQRRFDLVEFWWCLEDTSRMPH